MDQMTAGTGGGSKAQDRADARTAEGERSLCPTCGAEVRAATVSTALWEGDALSVVRDVPALVCRGCHEHYFSDDTVMRLDLMRAGGFASASAVGEMSVPVFRFPAAEEGQT